VGAVVGVGAAVTVGAAVGVGIPVAVAVGALLAAGVAVADAGVIDGSALGPAIFTQPATRATVASVTRTDFDTLRGLLCVKCQT
jgi:hypothetical protein